MPIVKIHRMRKCQQTSSAGMLGAMAQPTILREYKSSTTARYTQGHKQPTAQGPNVGDVRNPGSVGLNLLKLAIQHVFVHRQILVGVGGVHELGFPGRLTPEFLHQATHAMTPYLNSLFCQCLAQTAAAIALTSRFEHTAQSNPRAAMRLRLTNSSSGISSRTADAQQLATLLYRHGLL